LSPGGVRAEAVLRDPLDAVPVVPVDVRSTAHGRGLVLERRIAAEGRVGALVERTLGLRRTRRFELDELGKAYFEAVDGTRTLAAIARELAKQRGLELDEGQRAVRAFTQTLVSRGLLALRLDG
jgi:hypothetical protein